ncbi:COG1470 family protein [Chryseobacterium sp. MYb328]|uniref:COG1470 family protein n=1 Tax=Chryseobacterium sp. MYb328 TaxID=2745231 RepID=UPI0030993924
MIKTWTQFTIILFPLFAFSQQQSHRLVSKKDSLMPGMSTSIPFSLQNNSSENKVYDISVTTSSPLISPILVKGESQIPPHEASVYLVPLRISAEATQGNYSVILNMTDRSNGISLTKVSQITVSANRNLSLTVLDSPEFTRSGETIHASFLVKNNGNVTENLILESKNATIDHASSITLGPNESKVISIYKKTSPELGQNEFQNLNLSVYSKENPKENQTAYISTQVISVKPANMDIYHRLPIAASLSFIGMKNMGIYHDGFQGEIYGKGSLDKENKNQIEFHAVTHNPIELNTFTQYEEYFVNYKRDNLFIHLGDKTYSSSYLTEFARYGRGAEIRYDFNKVSLGGFYNHPRFFRDIKDEFNIYSAFKIRKESEISVGYLYKTPITENVDFGSTRLDTEAHLPYTKGKFKISKNINLSGEFAYSTTKKNEGTAYMAQAEINFTKFNGNLMYMKASPEFAGYFTNTNTFSGSIQYKLSKKINVFANYMQDAKNFQRDTLFLAAPYRKYFQYGIQYKYLSNGFIIFNNGYQKYQDRLEPKQFDYYERFFRVSVDQRIGIFQINVEGQFGKTDNYLTDFSGNSSLYSANLSFEKFKTSFSLFGSYAITSRYQLLNQKQFYYGARVFSKFSDKTSLSIFYQNNYIPEEYFKDRNLFELLFHQQLFPGNELDLSGRYTLQRGQIGDKDFIFSIRYTWRPNIPVQRTAEYVSLSGNVSNLGIKKTEGIRLMMGSYLSVTDKEGNYIFKNVIPGNYFLEIDRSTTEINDIPTVILPATLPLNNKENIFNFGLTTAASIQGSIQLSETEEKNQTDIETFQAKKGRNKRESIIVEAISNEQTYRKICFIGEDFDFTYLRPGEWIIKLYRNGLDKRYKISNDKFQFTLNPSETKKLSIQIVKQQIEIKYQQESLKVGYNQIKNKK